MLKQFIFLPIKPIMSKGKLASQSAHASYFALKNQKNKKLINKWEITGNCVIVFEVKNQLSLIQIDKYLEQWKIPHHLYIDEGHTEVEPLSATALATGIIKENDQWIFEKFKLFKR